MKRDTEHRWLRHPRHGDTAGNRSSHQGLKRDTEHRCLRRSCHGDTAFDAAGKRSGHEG